MTINGDIEDNIYISGNGAQLSRLVAILLDNAINHSSNSDKIKLKLKAEHRNQDIIFAVELPTIK